MSNPTQAAIIWPDKFLPGTTDNYVSNEIIAKDVTAAQVWALLADISKWPSYYKNCDAITPPNRSGSDSDSGSGSGSTLLQKDDHFQFATFGFPPLHAYVQESVAPSSPGGTGGASGAGRIAWYAPVEDGVEVYHAWVVEDLPGNRVRVLTQESQIGEVFVGLREDKPNKMLLGHQDWLDGLVKAARGQDITSTNLGSVGAWERK